MDLNSVDRYVKSSPRFVLEEYSHCEVPAGCGGVVLRWRDRFTSIPLKVTVAVVGAPEWEVRLDGDLLPTVRPLLSPGRHVLMVAATGVDPSVFAFLLWCTSEDIGDEPLLWTPGPPDAWCGTDTEPDPAAWTDPDHDTSAWQACVPALVADSAETPYSARRTLRLGAQPITVDPVPPAVWLRAVFEIPEVR